MPYLFTLYHPKKKSYTQLPLENGPDTIPAMYYLADREGYEEVMSRQEPLSQVSWFIEKDFDEEEEKMYLGMSDEEYFLSIVRSKAVYFIEELVANWYPFLKSSKKTLEVYLFGESPLRHQLDHLLGNDMNGNIQVHLSKELMEKLIEAFNYRTYIPQILRLEPEFDLLMGLDFKMYPWRDLLSQESPIRFSDTWMHWLWIGRNQGIARFPALLKGVDSEMNSYHIRQYLENLMRQLVREFENGDQNLDKFHHLLDQEKLQMYRIAPQLMLHASRVYGEKYNPTGLEESLKKLSGSFSCDHQAIRKVFIQSKKIDFDQWLEFLTLPTKMSPPMVQADLLRKLNRILLSLDQKNSIFRDMLEDHYPERFQLKLSLRRDEKFLHPYEGVRVEINSSVLSRFQVLAETWT